MIPSRDLFEPITVENVSDLRPGEWIWDDRIIRRRIHKRSLGEDYAYEAIGFRQIHILDVGEYRNVYYKKPFMLSTIDDPYSRTNHEWVALEPNRFYKFKKEYLEEDEVYDP